MATHARNISTSKPSASRSFDKFLLILSLLVLLVVVLSFTSNILKSYFNVAEVHVPNLLGVQLEEAQRILKNFDLAVNTYPESSPEKIFNTVISQSPLPNAVVRKGREISLGVNLPQEVTVPNIVGLTQEEALTMIEALGLHLGEVSYDSSDLTQGQIISSEPLAETIVGSGSAINVIVSRGHSSEKLVMPQLIGLTLQSAKNRLTALGIRRIETSVSTVDRSRLGVVTGQQPEAGQTIFSSSTVNLYHALTDPNVIVVPNVVGLTLQQARTKLQNAGLDIRSQWIQYKTDPNKAQGIVEQRPTGYALVGTPVALIINGLPLGDNALNASGNASQTTSTTTYPLPPEQPIGSVPLGSPLTPRHSPYTTSPSNQPTTPSTPPTTNNYTSSNARTIPITFNPASYGFLQGQTNVYKLLVIDDRGEREEIVQVLQAGESVNTQITVYGRAELRTYINNSFFQAWNP